MADLETVQSRFLFPIGLLVVKIPFLRGYKEHLLSTWHDTPSRSRIDGLLFGPVFHAWVSHEYLREPDPDRREALKGLAMGGESGRSWAEYYDRPLDFSARIGNLGFHEAWPLFRHMETTLSGVRTALVVQVGSSSGREIAYFAARYPANQFIGTDIYPGVLGYSAAHHRGDNLSFQLLPAKEIGRLLSEFPEREAVVFSSGSLQYVQPEHLDLFFGALSRHRARIILVEPGSDRDGSPDALGGSRWRDNFSYTHDYRFYAERAGFRTLASSIIRPYKPAEQYPGQHSTIHYSYCGESGPGR
jgi:hypothetical protein